MSIIRVPVYFDYGQPDNPAMNVWHVRITGSASSNRDVLENALDHLKGFYAGWYTYAATGHVYLGEGMIEDPLGDPTYVDDYPLTQPMGDGAPAGPSLLAIVASWRTTSASRSGRGRTFCGPLSKNMIGADGTPENTVVSAIRNSAHTLLNASGGTNGWAVGVLSTKQRLLRDITGVSVRDRWSYLSSRRD